MNTDPYRLPDHLNTNSFDYSSLVASSDLFVADGVRLIGDIQLGFGVSIWFNTVLRGDVNRINIGNYTNIQDGCIVHVTNNSPCSISNHVTVGHHVNLHACTVEEKCLIGIGAIILTGAKIGRGSVIAAGAVIKENELVPPFSLMGGIPAKKIKTLSETVIQEHEAWAKKYYQLSKHYLPNPNRTSFD